MTSFNPSDEEQRYFAEKEIERRRDIERKQASDEERAAAKVALAEVVKIEDDDVLEDLLALGYTADTVGVLPIVPLIAVAWADGEVQAKERTAIMELAEKRGVDVESDAYKTLDGLLTDQPTDEYLHSCIYVLREIYESLTPQQNARAKRNLINFARVIADSAGGVFGLFGNKVADEEKQVIDQIAGWLGVNESSNTDKVQNSLVSAEADEPDSE